MLAESTITANSRPPGWGSSPATRGSLLFFALAACLVGVGFSLYTRQIQEDALITLRHGENLVRGQGLVYNAGERVHGFTSPINVLLLTICHVLTGASSYQATLWLYRLFTIAAFAGGGVLVLRSLANTPPTWAVGWWGFAVVYLFNPTAVAFSTNGMETGFMLLFVGWGIYLLTFAEEDRWLARGFCWASLMWTRPDGCVYIVALALAELLFFHVRPRGAGVRSLAKSGAICALVYAPWFLWAWWYYGSPIPHTILAKANAEQGTLAQLLATVERLPEGLLAAASRGLRPMQFAGVDSWIMPAWCAHLVFLLSKLLGGTALIYWLLPIRDPLGRAASFCYAMLNAYLSFLVLPYLWYFPPTVLFGLVALVRAATLLATWPHTAEVPARIARRQMICAALVITVCVGQLALFALNTRGEEIFQREIETGQRTVIGQWLKEHGQPSDTVYLEPLGYIGYFSGMRMVDFPGLVSSEVVRLRREKHVDRIDVIQYLDADWLVLRYREAKALFESSYSDAFKRDYHLERLFDVNDKISQYGDFPLDSLIRYDAAYAVFRKNKMANPLPSSALPPEIK